MITICSFVYNWNVLFERLCIHRLNHSVQSLGCLGRLRCASAWIEQLSLLDLRLLCSSLSLATVQSGVLLLHFISCLFSVLQMHYDITCTVVLLQRSGAAEAGLCKQKKCRQRDRGQVKNGCKSHQPQNWDRSEWYGDVKTLDWEIAPFLTRAWLPQSWQRLVLSLVSVRLRLFSVCPLREVFNLGVPLLF